MKKKIILIIIVILVILAILCIPRKYNLKDGGSVVYEAILWKYEKVNTLEGDKGNRLYILGIEIIDNVKSNSQKKNKNEIDTDYDYNTTVKLDNTEWKGVEQRNITYSFNQANVKNGLTIIDSFDEKTKASYRVYTGDKLKQYEERFNSSQANLKKIFNENINRIYGEKIPFGLVVDLEIDNNSDAATGQQTHFEYYGIYSEGLLVLAEVGSYDKVESFVRSN